MLLADIIWLYMLSTTNDYAVTLYTRSHAFNARVLSRILFWTLDFTILVSTGRKVALSSSASPAVLFAGDSANCLLLSNLLSPVDLRNCGHTVHVLERASTFKDHVSNSAKFRSRNLSLRCPLPVPDNDGTRIAAALAVTLAVTSRLDHMNKVLPERTALLRGTHL
ncbi:hypothetical protein BJV77DRAFT_587609 [Russula vinacea]|nr:hypothetical protein BJV77DRAFT_587609 [Russula vinacea]